MADDVITELRRRVTDPEELAKFERFHRLYEKRMTKLGPDAGPAAMVEATMKCWRKAFRAEWPQTKASSTTTEPGSMKPAEQADPKAKSTAAAARLKAKLDARPAAGPALPAVAQHQRPTIATRG